MIRCPFSYVSSHYSLSNGAVILSSDVSTGTHAVTVPASCLWSISLHKAWDLRSWLAATVFTHPPHLWTSQTRPSFRKSPNKRWHHLPSNCALCTVIHTIDHSATQRTNGCSAVCLGFWKRLCCCCCTASGGCCCCRCTLSKLCGG